MEIAVKTLIQAETELYRAAEAVKRETNMFRKADLVETVIGAACVAVQAMGAEIRNLREKVGSSNG